VGVCGDSRTTDHVRCTDPAVPGSDALLGASGHATAPGVKPFGLKRAQAVWDLSLAVFSLIGFMRTAPHLLNIIVQHGPVASICWPADKGYGSGAVGLWTMLFIFSKVPELIDTAFVILRGKPLIFLHWYHHATVLLYCWHSYATRASPGLYFVAMNYGVHALMYFCECVS